MNDNTQSVTEKTIALAGAVQVLREQMAMLTEDVVLELATELFNAHPDLQTFGWEQRHVFLDNYKETICVGDPLINGKVFDDDNESMSQFDLEGVDVAICWMLRNLDPVALHKLYGDGVVTFHRDGKVTVERA
jgi:hypothetical protein